jgi:hypothetical protein
MIIPIEIRFIKAFFYHIFKFFYGRADTTAFGENCGNSINAEAANVALTNSM